MRWIGLSLVAAVFAAGCGGAASDPPAADATMAASGDADMDDGAVGGRIPGGSIVGQDVDAPGDTGTQDQAAVMSADAAAMPDAAIYPTAPDGPRPMPKLSFSPKAVMFMPAKAGACAGDSCEVQSLMVVNVGDAATDRFFVRLAADSTMDFSWGFTGCTAPLPPGAACSIRVAFTPRASGWRMGTVEAVDERGSLLLTCELKGFGL